MEFTTTRFPQSSRTRVWNFLNNTQIESLTYIFPTSMVHSSIEQSKTTTPNNTSFLKGCKHNFPRVPKTRVSNFLGNTPIEFPWIDVFLDWPTLSHIESHQLQQLYLFVYSWCFYHASSTSTMVRSRKTLIVEVVARTQNIEGILPINISFTSLLDFYS